MVKGVAVVTVSRGWVVWKDNQLRVKRGRGKFIPRQVFGPVFEGMKEKERANDVAQKKVVRKPYTGPVIKISKL